MAARLYRRLLKEEVTSGRWVSRRGGGRGAPRVVRGVQEVNVHGASGRGDQAERACGQGCLQEVNGRSLLFESSPVAWMTTEAGEDRCVGGPT